MDEWFGGAPQIEVKEDAVGLGHYGRRFQSEASANLSCDEK
jgi:hypothetical protein